MSSVNSSWMGDRPRLQVIMTVLRLFFLGQPRLSEVGVEGRWCDSQQGDGKTPFSDNKT